MDEPYFHQWKPAPLAMSMVMFFVYVHEGLHVQHTFPSPVGYLQPAQPAPQPDEPASPLGWPRPIQAASTFASGSVSSGVMLLATTPTWPVGTGRT